MQPRRYHSKHLKYSYSVDELIDEGFVGGNSDTSSRTDSSQDSYQYNYSADLYSADLYSADLNLSRGRDIDELLGEELKSGTDNSKDILWRNQASRS